MNLKEKIMNIFARMHFFLYPAPFINQKIKYDKLQKMYINVVSDNIGQLKEIKRIKQVVLVLQEKTENLKLKLKVLAENQLKNVCPYPQAKYWNEKRPYKEIVYGGRYLPRTDLKMSIPVQLFITAKDPVILKDIKNHSLQIENPSKCDEKIIKIYKHTRIKPLNKYRYVSDLEAIGVPEFWFLPFELRAAKQGDCDDYGNELASYLIAAGVPRFRIRCVAGKTYSGFGHLTVYVLADDLKTWHHINSTTPYDSIPSGMLKDFPKSSDKTDLNGIKTVWFSYNDKHAWSEFETTYQEKDFKKTIKDVKII